MLRSLLVRGESEDFEKLSPVMKVLVGETWRTWQWVETNAWMLASLMAMAQVDGGLGLYSSDTGVDFNKSPSWSTHKSDNLIVNNLGDSQGALVRHGRSMDSFTSLVLLLAIFVVGVTTGLLWKVNQKNGGIGCAVLILEGVSSR